MGKFDLHSDPKGLIVYLYEGAVHCQEVVEKLDSSSYCFLCLRGAVDYHGLVICATKMSSGGDVPQGSDGAPENDTRLFAVGAFRDFFLATSVGQGAKNGSITADGVCFYRHHLIL